MIINSECPICKNYHEVHVEVGYIRISDDEEYFAIPEDRLPVWNNIMERIEDAPTYQACQPIMDEQWEEFKDCHVDRDNVENYRVIIE